MLKRFAALLCALLSLTWAAPSAAAIGTPASATFVSTTTNNNFITATVAANYNVGDLIVVMIRWGVSSGTIGDIVDSKGNTWTCTTLIGQGSVRLKTCASKLATALVSGVDTLTSTMSASGTSQRIFLYTSVTGTGSLDKNITGGTSAASANVNSTSVATTGTLSAATEIVFGIASSSQNMTAEPSGYTSTVGIPGSPNTIDINYKITSSTAAETPVWTSASGSWLVQLMSFTEAPPASAVRSRALSGVGQ